MVSSIVVASCAILSLVPLTLLLLRASSSYVTKKEEKKEIPIIDSLVARARANVNVKEKYGILNSFVSADEHVRTEFRSAMMAIKNAFHSNKFDPAVSYILSQLPDTTTLKENVQLVVMGTVLKALLEEELPPIEDMKTASTLIDNSWSAEEVNENERKELHKIIRPEVLSKLIPAWESQWRLIYYSLLEFFSRPDERKYALENPDKWVKEALRLYPPVKRIIRKNEQGEEVSISIVDAMKDEAVWGRDINNKPNNYLEFDPRREYTKEQEAGLKMVFGQGKLQCIAGLNFVLKFCGGIMKIVGESYVRVDEEEKGKGEDAKWTNLKSPLENRRDVALYARLSICKHN